MPLTVVRDRRRRGRRVGQPGPGGRDARHRHRRAPERHPCGPHRLLARARDHPGRPRRRHPHARRDRGRRRRRARGRAGRGAGRRTRARGHGDAARRPDHRPARAGLVLGRSRPERPGSVRGQRRRRADDDRRQRCHVRSRGRPRLRHAYGHLARDRRCRQRPRRVLDVHRARRRRARALRRAPRRRVVDVRRDPGHLGGRGRRRRWCRPGVDRDDGRRQRRVGPRRLRRPAGSPTRRARRSGSGGTRWSCARATWRGTAPPRSPGRSTSATTRLRRSPAARPFPAAPSPAPPRSRST